MMNNAAFGLVDATFGVQPYGLFGTGGDTPA